jgi:phage/plasmid-associated DNA primase
MLAGPKRSGKGTIGRVVRGLVGEGNVVRSGAYAKTAQMLARHSTVQLTLGRSAHATLMDLASAVGALPPI